MPASDTAAALARRYAPFCHRPEAAIAADLEAHAGLLLRWNRARNLVSRETIGELWTRHMADSLQLLRHLGPARVIVDLGSGGGFPGIPLAIGLKDGPARLHLVEANAGKASFLRAVCRELALPAEVHKARIEALSAGALPPPDLVTARALAPLDRLLALALPLMQPGSRALFPKGRRYREEIAAAARAFRFDVLVHASEIGDNGVILELGRVAALGESPAL